MEFNFYRLNGHKLFGLIQHYDVAYIHHMFIPIKSQVLRLTGMFCRKCKLNTNNSAVVAKINLVQSIIFKGAFHQRRSSLNQVQIWPWPRFSRNFCCTNAVQIKSRVKLG